MTALYRRKGGKELSSPENERFHASQQQRKQPDCHGPCRENQPENACIDIEGHQGRQDKRSGKAGGIEDSKGTENHSSGPELSPQGYRQRKPDPAGNIGLSHDIQTAGRQENSSQSQVGQLTGKGMRCGGKHKSRQIITAEKNCHRTETAVKEPGGNKQTVHDHSPCQRGSETGQPEIPDQSGQRKETAPSEPEKDPAKDKESYPYQACMKSRESHDMRRTGLSEDLMNPLFPRMIQAGQKRRQKDFSRGRKEAAFTLHPEKKAPSPGIGTCSIPPGKSSAGGIEPAVLPVKREPRTFHHHRIGPDQPPDLSGTGGCFQPVGDLPFCPAGNPPGIDAAFQTDLQNHGIRIPPVGICSQHTFHPADIILRKRKVLPAAPV